MLTKMTDADWVTVLNVFKASRSRRGDKGRDDKKFLSALHYFAVHNITWRALPAEFGNWNSIWNTKDVPAFFPKILYKGRTRIEQAVGKLKRFKRIALRCEKTAQNYGSFVALALGFILIKSVHTA